MANLATMIMEGTAIYGSSKLKHKYDHVDGPALIAMESAEALRDIFETAFYENNACSIRAVAEGYTDFDSSPYAAMMEGIIADAFQKVKDFLIKLKDKIIAFFHSMVRYLSGIFMDGKKWVTKYEKELNAIRSNLKDYEVSIYDYRKDLDSSPDKITTGYTEVDDGASKLQSKYDSKTTKMGSDGKKERDDDAADKEYEEFVKKLLDGRSFSVDDDLAKECWSYFRNGADNDGDKEKKEVTSFFGDAIKALKDSDKTISKLNKAITAADNMYKKIIKKIEKLADEQEKTANDSKTDEAAKTPLQNKAEEARAVAALVSRFQSALNTFGNAWKSAIQERNKAYQSALVGAFAYARKNKKD